MRVANNHNHKGKNHYYGIVLTRNCSDGASDEDIGKIVVIFGRVNHSHLRVDVHRDAFKRRFTFGIGTIYLRTVWFASCFSTFG